MATALEKTFLGPTWYQRLLVACSDCGAVYTFYEASWLQRCSQCQSRSFVYLPIKRVLRPRKKVSILGKKVAK